MAELLNGFPGNGLRLTVDDARINPALIHVFTLICHMTRTILSYQPVETSDRGGRDRYVVLALLCAAAAIAYVQRSAISVPAGWMAADFHIGIARFSNVMSAWLLGYALAQIPSG